MKESTDADFSMRKEFYSRSLAHSYQKGDFKKDLKDIADKLQDDDFAKDVYRALCNMRWQSKNNPKKVYSCTWRYAGELVAELRAKGEIYLDFYLSGGEGGITKEVGEAFGEMGMGWVPLSWGKR